MSTDSGVESMRRSKSREKLGGLSSFARSPNSMDTQSQNTHGLTFPLSSELEFLLSEFTKLRISLVAEVHSSQYEIAQDVRKRFESDILKTHNREREEIWQQLSKEPEKNTERVEDAEASAILSTDVERTRGELGPTGLEAAHQGNQCQSMELQTESGPLHVPIDVRIASEIPDEKRKRNAPASHHFRKLRKQKEAALKEKEAALKEEKFALEALGPESHRSLKRRRTLGMTRGKEHHPTTTMDTYPTQEPKPTHEIDQPDTRAGIPYSYPRYKPFTFTGHDAVGLTE